MPSVYAAPFDLAPGRSGWLLVQDNSTGLKRVSSVSDWLFALASSSYAPNTLKSKAESLALWWRWCVDQGVDPLSVGPRTFARFVTALQTVPFQYDLSSSVRSLPGDPRLRSMSTVANRVINIKTFYTWAGENGRVAQAACKAVTGFRTPRAPKRIRATRLLPPEVKTLFSAKHHPRDRFVLELIYGCGLRKGEALGLSVVDLCLSAGVAEVMKCPIPRAAGPHVHVRRRINANGAFAKSYNERVVPLPLRAIVAYRDWQAWAFEHAPETATSPHAVIVLEGPTRGRALTPSGFDSLWKSKVQSLPGLEDATPHVLRHTYASELMDAGVERFVVQELLGHASPASTQIYSHQLVSTMSAAVQRLASWRHDDLGLL